MAKSIKVLVNTGNEETNKTFDVVAGSGKQGKTTRVKAVKGARYHLEDPAAKNVGPENIRSKRVGKNLHVMLDGSTEPDLIIEDYYDDAMLTENNRGLYGRAEDGKLYEYIPEDPTPAGLPINMADGGKPVSQVLGGGQVAEEFALSGLVLAAAGFNGLGLAAGAIGAAAISGGKGGGGGGNVTPTPTPTPATSAKITTINDPSNGSSDSGSSNSDFITNDNTLIVKGTVANLASGNKLRVKITNSAGTLTVADLTVSPDASGNWSADFLNNALGEGKYNIVVDVLNSSGTVVTADLTTQALVIDKSTSDNPNNNPVADPNSAVTLSIDSIDDGLTTTTNATGTKDTGFSKTDFITADGSLTIKGVVNGFTNTGGAAGDKVRVQILSSTGALVAETYTDPVSGAWSFNNQANTLTDGNYTVRAAVVDAAGNVVKAANDKPLIISSRAADSNARVYIHSISTDSGEDGLDFVTNDATPLVQGTTNTQFNATTEKVFVQILDSTNTVVSEGYVSNLVTGVNSWTFDHAALANSTTISNLVDGTYTIRAVITSTSGIEIANTAVTHSMVIDHSGANNQPNNNPDPNTSVVINIVTIDDGIAGNDNTNNSNDTGTSAADFITNDDTLIIKGTVSAFNNTGANAGEKVLVKIIDSTNHVVASQYVTPAGDLSWQMDITQTVLPTGKYTINAVVVDLAGNEVTTPVTHDLVIDKSTSDNPGNNPTNDDNNGSSTAIAITPAVATSQAVTISSLFATSFTDVNSNTAANGQFVGVAITNAGTSSQVSTQGKYQISTDGSTWTDLAAGLTDTTAVYAATTAQIRFVGVSGVEAINPQNLVVRLIDGTDTGHATGNTVNVSTNGGSTPYSGNTVTLNLTNSAPTTSQSTVVGDLFAPTPIGGTAIDGAAAAATVPTGWTITTGSPDIVSPGSSPFGASYVPSNLDGTSQNGGTYVELVGGGASNESMSTTLTGLTVGQTYAYAVQWQQTTLTYTGGINAGSGGKLVMTVNGTTQTFTSSGLSDTWQTATMTFVATATTATVTLANDVTMANGTGMIAVDSLSASAITGGGSVSAAVNVETLFSNYYADANANAFNGIAVTSAGSSAEQTSLGKYQYSKDGGTTWTDLGAGLTDSTAVYLTRTDLVRFVPSSANTVSVKPDLAARLVDTTSTFTDGATVDVSGANHGGTTAVSSGVITLQFSANTAPVLADTSLNMASVSDAGSAPTGAVGSLVSTLVSTSNVTDVDTANGKGMAITGVDTTKGSLYYSLDGGTTWTQVTQTLSDSNALLLKADSDNRVYFKPNSGLGGTSVASALTFRAWDQTSGSEGSYVNTSVNGGHSAFSSATDVVNQNVTVSAITPTNAINGGKTNGYAGYSVSNAGDVNGDGYDDVIIGEWNNSLTGGAAGVSYVVYGSSATISGLNLTAVAAGSGGFAIQGQNASEAGYSVSSAGDVNGDGLVDLIVGGQYFGSGAGRSYVVFGKTGTTQVQLSDVAQGSGGFIIDPQAGTTTGTGYSVSSAGDVNGDGLSDVLVTNQYSGASYVVFGKTGTATINLTAVAAGSGGFVINDAAGGGGMVSSAGDVNGDGLADILVGQSVEATSAGTIAGRSYVVFGKTSTTAVDVATIAGGGTGGFVINGQAASDASGYSVSAAGDVNGDGLSDVVIGAPRSNNTNVGKSYVVFGQTGNTVINLSAVAAGTGGFVINGESLSSFGTSVSSAGDINGDGLADFIVGAGIAAPGGKSSAGRDYVIFGKTDGTAVNATAIAAGNGGFVINGLCANDQLGGSVTSVSSAGDVNGDGYADLIVSAYYASPASVTGAGQSYIIYGGPQFASGNVALGTGTSADELVVGTNGADTLVGNGGIDRFSAGAGNDTIVLQASDITNLANNTIASVKASVDGGTGYDTIRLTGGTNMDLTTISNVGGMTGATGESLSRINNIERIDLATDTAANTLKLSATDVKDMSGFNLIHSGTSADGQTWASGSYTLSGSMAYHQLVVDGGSNDVLSLQGATSSWVSSGTVTGGGTTYNVYTSASTNSQVFVKFGVTVNLNVAPIVLDLNGDGVVSYAQTLMDVNGDGHLDLTAWAAAQDGVLVRDANGDGKVSGAAEFAFARTEGETDLQGLAAVYDTNHDGVLDAQDAQFAEFGVWQDANGNGVADAGEFHSLASLGVASINLVSNGVASNPATGVTEMGHASATMVNGTHMLVADAAFDYRLATAEEQATHSVLQGETIFKLSSGLNLDLSAMTGANVLTEVDASTDAAANVIKLNLSDLLSNGTSTHTTLKLTGDSNDTVDLDLAHWTSTGTTVASNGHTYNVYNAAVSSASTAAEQLLIDQHMLITQHA